MKIYFRNGNYKAVFDCEDMIEGLIKFRDFLRRNYKDEEPLYTKVWCSEIGFFDKDNPGDFPDVAAVNIEALANL